MGECPVNFVPYQGACVRQCPTAAFEFVMDNNQPRCVLRYDNTKTVNLTPVSAVPRQQGEPLPTVESLRTSDPTRYAVFKTESDRVSARIAIIRDELDKNRQVEDAFKELQRAENIRDESPEAYQQARTNYYTLLQGPTWVEGEKQRVAKVEVDPLAAQYRDSYNSLASRQKNQQRTQDIMKSVKDGVLTLKDDFKYTTSIFKDQIENLKNQINIERRGREKVEVDGSSAFYKWVDALFNLFIIAGLFYAIFVFWQKLRTKPQPTYAPIALPR